MVARPRAPPGRLPPHRFERMDPVRPDYGGEAITSLVPALLGGHPAPFMPSCVDGADAVVLLLLDGLGWQAVEAHRSLLPELDGLGGGPITTVAPSTTASALTSLATGLAPVAHEYGLHDSFYVAELRAADRLVGDLRDALPATTALLVTSDHGQIHIDRGGWIDLAELAPMIAMYAGEARFRYLYAKPGAAAELAAAARESVGDRAWVLTREQLFAEGWIGPAPEGPIGSRVGDVVLAAREPVAFVDPTLPMETKLLGMHGSLTPDEMYVPLLGGRGRA